MVGNVVCWNETGMNSRSCFLMKPLDLFLGRVSVLSVLFPVMRKLLCGAFQRKMQPISACQQPWLCGFFISIRSVVSSH